jgi:metal-responsive CopG/Arc/MetJ family transcriptional regulator
MEKTKKQLSITLDQKLCEIIDKKIENRSKYIEWLIYQDMLRNSDNQNIQNIVL